MDTGSIITVINRRGGFFKYNRNSSELYLKISPGMKLDYVVVYYKKSYQERNHLNTKAWKRKTFMGECRWREGITFGQFNVWDMRSVFHKRCSLATGLAGLSCDSILFLFPVLHRSSGHHHVLQKGTFGTIKNTLA